MNIQNLKMLAKELQDALPFCTEGLTTPDEHTCALAIMNDLVDDYDENILLIDVLWPLIENYEATAPEFSEFNERIAKMNANGNTTL